MRRTLLAALALILFALALSACGDDETPPPEPSATPADTPTPGPPSLTPGPSPTAIVLPEVNRDPATQALLRVVHAAPDLPPVDIYLEGSLIGRGFRFGMAHNPAQPFEAGEYLLRLIPAGDNPRTASPLLDVPLRLEEGVAKTIVIAGEGDALTAIEAIEDRAPLDPDTARVTLIDAAGGAPVALRSAGQTLIADVAAGAVSEPVTLPTGTVSFEAARDGETLATLDTTASAHTATTLVLAPDAEASYHLIEFDIRARSETPVRVVHASLDLGPVDVYFGDQVVASGLSPHSATDWTPVESGTVDLRVRPAGQPDAEPLYRQQLGLPLDQGINLVLLNPAANLRVIQVREDFAPLPADSIRLTFVNALVGVARMNILTGAGLLDTASPVGFGAASLPTLESTGAMRFDFVDPAAIETQNIVDSLSARMYDAGTSYLIVVSGQSDAEPLVLGTEVGTTGIPADNETALDPIVAPLLSPQARLAHGDPSIGPVDLLLNDEPLFDNVAPGTGTAYRPLTLERNELIVLDAAGDELLREMLPPRLPDQLTLILFPGEDGAPRLEFAEDSGSIGYQQARVRVTHGTPDQPRLQVLLLPDAGLEATPVGTPAAPQPVFQPVEYGQVSLPVSLPAGETYFSIAPASSTELIADLPPLALESRTAYDVILVPGADGQGIEAVTIAHAE